MENTRAAGVKISFSCRACVVCFFFSSRLPRSFLFTSLIDPAVIATRCRDHYSFEGKKGNRLPGARETGTRPRRTDLKLSYFVSMPIFFKNGSIERLRPRNFSMDSLTSRESPGS